MSASPVITKLAGPEHLEGLMALFQNASSGCYCRFWHFEGEDNDWLARCADGANRSSLVTHGVGGSDETQGVVALSGEKVVGWLKLCPAPAMSKLEKRRVYRTLSCFDGPRDGVLVIGCVLVHPDARRRGVARALITAAVAAARTLGASVVEAFPRVATHTLRDDELQMGPVGTYESLGFVCVDGPTPYPVMRLQLAPREAEPA